MDGLFCSFCIQEVVEMFSRQFFSVHLVSIFDTKGNAGKNVALPTHAILFKLYFLSNIRVVYDNFGSIFSQYPKTFKYALILNIV